MIVLQLILTCAYLSVAGGIYGACRLTGLNGMPRWSSLLIAITWPISILVIIAYETKTR